MNTDEMNGDGGAGEGGPERVFFSREAISGVPWMVVSKALLFFVYIGISVVTVRWLGKTEYGLFSLCKNIGDYLFMFCSMGLISAISRFVPELVVTKNRAGLVRFLKKSALLQAGATLLVLGGVLLLKPWMNRWFQVDFRFYLVLTVVYVAASLLKTNLTTLFTALFKVRFMAGLSIAHGVLWFLLLAGGLTVLPTVSVAFAAEIAAMVLVYLIAAVVLFRWLKQLNWRSPPRGVGRRRALSFSGANLLTSVVRMMMYQYTEIFFLGVVAGPATVGIYNLGFELPALVIPFIPMAIQPLFAAAFSEAYIRDPNCLENLIRSFYKILVIVSFPLSAFGFFFASQGMILIYGAEMAEAGPLAAAFCLIQVLKLISMPLSLALQAKEKVMNMLPLLLLQVAVNLVLDWLLIVHWRMGVWGGVVAVLLTFVLTIPARLAVCRRLTGGIHFPVLFAVKMSGVFFITAALFSLVRERLTLPLLLVVALLYLGVSLGVIRGLRLIRPEDVRDFRDLRIGKLDLLLNLLTPHR